MPKYITDYGHAEISLELPGIMKGTHAYLFAFPCDPVNVQKMVDTYLNNPANGHVRYEMMGDQLFAAFLHVDQLTSNLELMGYTTDRECGLWIPLVAKGDGHDRLVVWMPYIVIDWQQGMVTGREVLGYRKTMGEVIIPLDHDKAEHFEVKTNVFPKFSRDAKEIFTTLLTITASNGGAKQSDWKEIGEAVGAFKDVWRAIGLLQTIKMALSMEIPIVNLKQFRAAHDTTEACYQAIIECGIGIHGFHGGGFLDDEYVMNIVPADSHRILSDLGLTTPLKADFAIWMSLDLSADNGREVVRSI